MDSIARRIRRMYFIMSLWSMAVMVTMVVMVNEDLEYTMLQSDVHEEQRFFLGHQDPDKPQLWEAASLVAQFIPEALVGRHPVAPLFVGLPQDFAGEIERDGRTFLMNTGQDAGGRFYIAKDISRFEERETLFNWMLAALSLAFVVMSFGLASLSSRRIARPLGLLAEQIRQMPAGPSMPRLQLDFEEVELHTIARTFNNFLDELEAFVKREQALVNLASHELRTPIAVISGALDVLDQRGKLATEDQVTLARMRRASNEMEQNVAALLKLARKSAAGLETRVAQSLPSLLEEVLEDLSNTFDVYQRVDLDIQRDVKCNMDPVMAKMLVRNLIQNALQHTAGKVRVSLYPDYFEIADKGHGLASPEHELLEWDGAVPVNVQSLTGFGLYIATIVCERLAWRLDVSASTSSGTVIRVYFG